ncbi:MAG TPA: hypothetical protein VMU77_02220, partial [Acidimicrobiales bacterium]|nr:hypothetical protein [Acidimicrobiales bacterium]
MGLQFGRGYRPVLPIYKRTVLHFTFVRLPVAAVLAGSMAFFARPAAAQGTSGAWTPTLST